MPPPPEATAAAPGPRVVLALGTAQTLAWASSFYLPAMLAVPMADELGVAVPTIYALLSMALIVSALAGPTAGRLIDRHGGRPVLMAGSGVFALGLAALATAQGPRTLAAAWALLGLAMGLGLYDAAFAALVRLYGPDARTPITGITLVAGFASTVGWPMTALLEAQIGWRGACAVWALLHLVLALPLHATLPRAVAAPAGALPAGPTALACAPEVGTTEAGAIEGGESPPPVSAAAAAAVRPRMALLAAVFALMSVVSTGIATHLPAVLMAGGATLTVAVATAALMGPAQVAARLLELGLARRWPLRATALVTARVAALGHPLAAALLLTLGAAGALPFALVHGLGNGLVTIIRGTLPLALFGAAGYGARQGWLTLPARVLGALSPWLFGLALARWGVAALWGSAALSLAACAGLLCLRLPRR